MILMLVEIFQSDVQRWKQHGVVTTMILMLLDIFQSDVQRWKQHGAVTTMMLMLVEILPIQLITAKLGGSSEFRDRDHL